jgi:hypothetical protein
VKNAIAINELCMTAAIRSTKRLRWAVLGQTLSNGISSGFNLLASPWKTNGHLQAVGTWLVVIWCIYLTSPPHKLTQSNQMKLLSLVACQARLVLSNSSKVA